MIQCATIPQALSKRWKVVLKNKENHDVFQNEDDSLFTEDGLEVVGCSEKKCSHNPNAREETPS